MRSGYAYKYEGKRNWKSSSDERWEIVVVDALECMRIGERRVDGTWCAVYRTKEGALYAQRSLA
jgi:hypothetical protein